MCLKLNMFSFKHKAKKDIIVYKKVFKLPLMDDFVTPYRGNTVVIGKTDTSELIKERSNLKIKHYHCNLGLHSFANKSDIEINRYDYIVESIIPKGSYYYKGKFKKSKDEKYSSYASDKLTYIEII